MSISMIRAQNPQGVVADGYMLSLKANDLDELIGDQVRALRELEGSWHVVSPRPPNNTAPWVAIAATFTKLIQQLIEAFVTADQQLASTLKSIAAGHIPGNDPVPGPGMVDPDSLNNPQLQWQQGLAGSGDPFDGEGGAGVPNTDLSIMGMTPDGRLFTIQGDTSAGVKYDKNGFPIGGPQGKRLPDSKGGKNNISFLEDG
jgi:hypothetical protein